MRRFLFIAAVFVVLAAPALVASLLVAPAPADANGASCTVTCLTTQSTEQSACSHLQGDALTDCMHRASLKYRMCTQACPSAGSKTSPAATRLVPAKAGRD